jgi:hypothetical protein
VTTRTPAEQLREIVAGRASGSDSGLVYTLAVGVLEERDQLAERLNRLGRDYDAGNHLMNAALKRAGDAEAALKKAREEGWREEWNGQDRVLIKEILIDRVKPWADWARVTIDGYRLPWFLSKATASDIGRDTTATVTLTFEAGLIVQSNAAPLDESDTEVLAREETLIARMRDAPAPTDG